MLFQGIIQLALLIVVLTLASISDIKTHECKNIYSMLVLVISIPSFFRFGIIECVFGMLSVFVPLFIIAMIKKGGIGGADIKLGSALGLVVSFPFSSIGLLISMLMGTLTMLIINKVNGNDTKNPFALIPFLSFGFIVSHIITLI